MSERTIDDILSDFANATGECEALRCQGMSSREQTMRADELRAELNARFTAARREVETVNEEAERQAGVICNLNTDLATSRAALEDVRRVVEYVPIHFNSHVYREAILRALAQEAGDETG